MRTFVLFGSHSGTQAKLFAFLRTSPFGEGTSSPWPWGSPCCGTRLEDGIVGDWGTASLSLATNEMFLSFV